MTNEERRANLPPMGRRATDTGAGRRGGPATPAAAPVPSRRVRLGVGSLLVVLLVGGLAGVEAWPVSGFRLFSVPRTAEDVGDQVVLVDRDGHERPLRHDDMPTGAAMSTRDIADFDEWDTPAQAERCAVWADIGRSLGVDVVAVRVDEVHSLKRPDAPPPTRSVLAECPVPG